MTALDDTNPTRDALIEGVKLAARNSMRSDPRVWHEALEAALDKVLPGFWDAARAAQPQPDWEYGEQSKYSEEVWLVDRDNTAMWDDIPSDRRVRRREAGPWEPVPDTRSNT